MGIKGFAAGVGIAALFVVGVACSGSDVDDQKQAVVETAPQPAAAPAQVTAVPPSPTLQSAPAPAAPQQGKIAPTPSASIGIPPPVSLSGPSSGSMIPRPANADQLVAGSSLIVIGTINAVLEEKQIGGYGVDGQLIPAEDGGIPVTDFDVRPETVLKSDGTIVAREGFVLRMHGHTNNDPAIVSPAQFELPRVGDRLLFALGRNPDGTFGSGPEGLLDISDSFVKFADGAPFAIRIPTEQFLDDILELSGNDSSPTQGVVQSHADSTGPDGGLTEDEFAILLTVQDVTSLLSSDVEFESEIGDAKAMAAGVDASQVVNIDSWYMFLLDSVDPDRGLTFTVMDFDSGASTLDHYDIAAGDESGLVAMDSPIGDASTSIDVNSNGIGGMLAFVVGDKLVSIYTTGWGDEPLLALSDIEALGKTVLSRL